MGLKLDTKKKVTSNLTFEPVEDFDNLCIGTLESVSVDYSDISKTKDNGEESKWEYAGHTIPRLVFKFKQVGVEQDRYFTHIENVISEMEDKKTLSPSMELTTKLYEQMWSRIKHILDAFGVEVTELPEFSVIGDTATKIEEFKSFFNIISSTLVGKDKNSPAFKDVKLIMKLVAEYKSRKYLCFPTFVGKGFIEKYKGLNKNNKLITILKVQPSETVKLSTLDSVASQQQIIDKSGPQTEEISDDIRVLLDN